MYVYIQHNAFVGVWQMGLMCPFSLRLAALFVFVPAIKLDKQN